MKRTMIVAAMVVAFPALAAEPTHGDCAPLPASLQGETWAIDGTTLSFVGDGGHRVIRIWGIEAPMLRDGSGRIGSVPGIRARAALDEEVLSAGRKTRCQAVERDRHCRLIAVCEAGGNDLSTRMVATGYALMSTHAALVPDHIDRGRQLAEAEAHARAKRAGLWAEWLGPKAVNED